MQRYYIHGFQPWKHIQISDVEIIHHCYKVLRLKSEDLICIFDWVKYFDYIYKITEITKDIIALDQEEIITKIKKRTSLTLYQSLPNKIAKLEYIIQKNTEIGIKKIIIFPADFSQKAIFINDKKIARLKKIAIEACEQSNNNVIPNIELVNLIDFPTIKVEKNIFLHLWDNRALALKDINLENTTENINIFIGPEWWFSEKEVSGFLSHNFQQLYLWESILRTETAWLVVWFYLLQSL